MADDTARALGGGALAFAIVEGGGVLVELNRIKNRLTALEQQAPSGGVSQAQLSLIIQQVNAAFATVSQQISQLQSQINALRAEIAALQAQLPPGRMGR